MNENNEKEKIVENYEDYAEKNDFQLNPNKKIVESVVKGLLTNEEKYGERYCPCRRVTGDKEEDTKKICPCVWHKKEIAEQGYCTCRLFVKK